MKRRTGLSYKILTLTAAAVAVGIAVPAGIDTSTSALTYQDTKDIRFTFNPTVNIQLSNEGFTIPEIVPGSAMDSNIVTITISSNNTSGYTLYGTVGNDDTYDYSDLRLSSDNATNVFSSLTSNVGSLDAFNSSQWGYAYSTDSGANWVSGDAGSTSSGYNGLPLHSNTGVILADTNSAASTSIQFKIGAKASSTQVAGSYQNVINFSAVTKEIPTD